MSPHWSSLANSNFWTAQATQCCPSPKPMVSLSSSEIVTAIPSGHLHDHAKSSSSVQKWQHLNAGNNVKPCSGKFIKYKIDRIRLFSTVTTINIWNKITIHRQVNHSLQRRYNQHYGSHKPTSTPDLMQSASPLPLQASNFILIHSQSNSTLTYISENPKQLQQYYQFFFSVLQHVAVKYVTLSLNQVSDAWISTSLNLGKIRIWKLTHCLQNATWESQSWTSSCWKSKEENQPHNV